MRKTTSLEQDRMARSRRAVLRWTTAVLTVIGVLVAAAGPVAATHETVQGQTSFSDGSMHQVVFEGDQIVIRATGVNVSQTRTYLPYIGLPYTVPGTGKVIPCYRDWVFLNRVVQADASGNIPDTTVTVPFGLLYIDYQVCFFESGSFNHVTAPAFLSVYSTTH